LTGEFMRDVGQELDFPIRQERMAAHNLPRRAGSGRARPSSGPPLRIRTQVERIDRRLAYVWPSERHVDRARFEKLKEAYVKARYSKHYKISEEELSWLGKQVEELGRVVHEVCAERIAELKRTAGVIA